MSSNASAPEPSDVDEEEGLPHSCYLLEFSVMPGGARQGDIHVGTTIDALCESLQHGIDDYLVIWYGAVLHLWIVQEGLIVEGIDLHPYLRTGDERCDRTLARIIELKEQEDDRWGAIDQVLKPYVFDKALALPLLTRVLELQDRIEADESDTDAERELDRILEAAEDKQAPTTFDGMTVERLHLDWDALGKAAPPLREPILATDWVSVRWADPDLRHEESHLHVYTEPTEPEHLHVGHNDLENGDDDF